MSLRSRSRRPRRKPTQGRLNPTKPPVTPVTFTTTVTAVLPGVGIPTGMVSFFNGGTDLVLTFVGPDPLGDMARFSLLPAA